VKVTEGVLWFKHLLDKEILVEQITSCNRSH